MSAFVAVDDLESLNLAFDPVRKRFIDTGGIDPTGVPAFFGNRDRPEQTATSRKPQPKHAAAFVENPRGAIEGYVAGRSMAGTKTNSAIMETPQAISPPRRERRWRIRESIRVRM